MTSNGSLADITTCIVPVPIRELPGQYKPCGQKFSSPRITVLGDSKARLNSYMEGLAKHLHDKHPVIGQIMVQHGAAFMEMLFLRNFTTTDPELSEQQDRMRWQVHQQTLKARYPDENLEEQAHQLTMAIWKIVCMFGTPDLNPSENKCTEMVDAKIAEAFRSIRDALEEADKYIPAASAKQA